MFILERGEIKMATIKVKTAYRVMRRNITDDLKWIELYRNKLDEVDLPEFTKELREWAQELLGDVTELCSRLDEDYDTQIYE